jgi:signal transduction histidine kinase
MIAGFSQALLDGTARGAEVAASAEVIVQEAEKMERLVDDLLQLTKLESGLLRLELRPVELGPLLERTADRRTRLGGGNGLSVSVEVAPGTPPVLADPDRLERALGNLVDNAIHYTPPPGRVTLTARPLGRNEVEIMVADTGVGIPAESLPRIFERFYRADRGREREHGHAGLGLAIVREIVEAHGGRIAVQSQLRRGTTFRLTLPRAAGVVAVRQTVPAGRREA